MEQDKLREDILKKDASLITDLSAESDVMLIAFGGIASEIGIPVFEFFKLLSLFAVKKIFVRDLEQAWYHNGLKGVGNDIDAIATYLQAQITQHKVRRVIMIGNSAGGYAALLFGLLVEVDEVHAFSPQTFINWPQRLWHLDFRWRQQIRKLYQSSHLDERYLDLKPLFQSRPSKTKFHIYFCERDRLDNLHASRMDGCSNLELHKYQEGGHRLVKWLKDRGDLERLIAQALQG
jgi:pimeloyl-ACP methyl ester carboxylesterase